MIVIKMDSFNKRSLNLIIYFLKQNFSGVENPGSINFRFRLSGLECFAARTGLVPVYGPLSVVLHL